MEKEVIIDQSCGMAVMRGADIFVQGILGAPTSICPQILLYCTQGYFRPL